MRFFFTLLFLCPLTLPAENSFTPKSVYDVNVTTDALILGVATAGAAIPYLFQNEWIHRRCPCLITEINGFDRGVVGNHSDAALTVSDILVAAMVVAPVVFNATQLGFEKAFWEDTTVFVEALAVSSALVGITKVIVQRPVPRSYEGDLRYVNSNEGYRSFFSGHTVTAATAVSAAAMNLILRYDQSVWPWFAAAGLTASVAALRIAGGVHFYTDTIVGAAVGATVGILVPLLHKKVYSPNSTSRLWIAPQADGAKVNWALTL